MTSICSSEVRGRFVKRSVLALAVCSFLVSATGRAASGTWNTDSGGSWDTQSNWLNNNIAGGVGSTAFLTFNITADREISLASNIILGNIFADDPTGNQFYSIVSNVAASPNTITLSTTSGTPTITVGSSEQLTLGRTATGNTNNVILAGTQGFIKTGAGKLLAYNGLANNTLIGDVQLQQGTMQWVGNVKGALVISSGATLQVAFSGGGNSIFYGVNSTSGGTIAPSSNSRTLTLNGPGAYSYAGTLTGAAGSANVNLVLSMTGGGSQTFTNGGATAQNYNNTTVNSGSLIYTGNGAAGIPFGVGNIILGSTSGVGQLKIASTYANTTPDVTVAAYTGVNTAVGSTFTYNNGAYLSLDKGTSGATGLTYTIGNANAAASSVLVRTSAAVGTNSQSGTLIVKPGSGLSALGTATGEKLIVNGGVTTANGITNPSIIGQDNDTNGSGSFLNYGANGFVLPTYTTGTLSGGTAFSDIRVFDVTATNTLTANAAVYALRASSTIDGAFNLSVGANSSTVPAVVILNSGTIATSTLSFGATAAGVIYTSGSSSISAAIQNDTTVATTGRGVTFEGPGVLTLSGINTFKGGAQINETTVSVSANNQLGYSDGTTGPGQVVLKGGTLKTTASFTLTNRGVILSPGITNGGGSFDVASGTTLTITGGTNSKIISGTGSLNKKGAGALLLNGTTSNTYSGGTIVTAGILQAGSATGFVQNSDYTVNGGTLDLNSFALTATAFSGTGGAVTLGNAAFTVNQTANVDSTYAGNISGTGGSLVNSGAGSLTLTGTNSYTGGTTVSAGTLKSGSSGAFVNNTAYTVNGGLLNLNGHNLIASSLSGSGGTVGLGSAALTVDQSGTTSYQGSITGSGSLTKSGIGLLTLTGSSSYSGGTAVSAGTLSVTNNSALGTNGVALSGTGSTAATQGTLLIGSGNTVANNLTFSGGQAQRVVAAAAAYNLGTTGTVTSAISGGTSTMASILQASTATAETTVTYSFNNVNPVSGTNNAVRMSDNFSLSGMESGKLFVLQLSIAEVTTGEFLGWYDTASNTYKNAVLGNSNAGSMGLTGFQGDGAYVTDTDFVLGYWGLDTASNTVWAVLDHNSEFIVAAVPEPSTVALLTATGFGMMVIFRRRMRKVA